MKSFPQTLIGFVGLRRSGKDTAAQALVEDGFRNIKFAGALKIMLRAYLRYVGISPEGTDEMIDGGWKEEPSVCFGGKSARYAMQTLGTEWGRDLISQDLWVNACLDRCKQFQNVVVSDVRFPNEIDAIRTAGGRVIRITRPGSVADSHVSEALINGLTVDLIIMNDGTIAQLHDRVRAEVKHFSTQIICPKK